MSSAVGHALCGVGCLVAARGRTGTVERLRAGWWIVAFAAVANLPDLDFLAGWILAGDPNRYHSGASHSLLAVALTVLAMAVPLAITRRLAVLPWLALALLSHLLLDLLSGPALGLVQSYGVPLWWPFSAARVRLPVSLFFGVDHASLTDLLSWRNVAVVLFEGLVFVPVVLLLSRLRHQPGAGNVGPRSQT